MVKWYVMQSKPNREFFLLSQLALNHVKAYLPLVNKIYSDGRIRKKPFFPGYLFVHVDLSEHGTSRLNWIPGSKGMVVFAEEPPFVPDKFIQHLKHKLSVTNLREQSKFSNVTVGNPVSIIKGPFDGYQAIFNEYLPEKDRVRLLLKTLSNTVFSIEIPAVDITV